MEPLLESSFRADDGRAHSFSGSRASGSFSDDAYLDNQASVTVAVARERLSSLSSESGEASLGRAPRSGCGCNVKTLAAVGVGVIVVVIIVITIFRASISKEA